MMRTPKNLSYDHETLTVNYYDKGMCCRRTQTCCFINIDASSISVIPQGSWVRTIETSCKAHVVQLFTSDVKSRTWVIEKQSLNQERAAPGKTRRRRERR
ncbi:hypothetical protein JOB18_047503 [Solea senegalensis]|uniref:Uncharacterized protein n=1 Tax=Solea senegalensis TaxID=28829 RepID=A0AAV6T288_SOLSE|nr:hypothetical protein JOB18_047503 [Solea senegalensis]